MCHWDGRRGPQLLPSIKGAIQVAITNYSNAAAVGGGGGGGGGGK